MIDIAKVADLVLLMIDASFGFEMVGFYANASALLQMLTEKRKPLNS
jgi:hypothetical protein